MPRLRVGVLFGGRSGEHEVSLMSAASIMRTLAVAGYEVVPIAITKEGKWLLPEDSERALKGVLEPGSMRVAMLPEPGLAGLVKAGGSGKALETAARLDVVFPALHGTYGEDGAIQGLLEMAGVPYVGAGVLGSAVGMDKDIQKRLFRQAGIPVLDFAMYLRSEFEREPGRVMDEVEKRFGYPCFIKPCNLGSSVGVAKAKDRPGLEAALKDAALYDRKLLVEQAALDAHEIECSVLGNDDPISSLPGEILPAREFYDYKAKYYDARSRTEVPARLPAAVIQKVRDTAVQCFKVADCCGMARVDFFVSRRDHSIFVNELNTIPGFTKISMYPKMWEATGISYEELLTRLVDLAVERHKDKNRNLTDYRPPQEDFVE